MMKMIMIIWCSCLRSRWASSGSFERAADLSVIIPATGHSRRCLQCEIIMRKQTKDRFWKKMVVTVPVHPSQVANGVATARSQAHVQVIVVPENRQSTMFCLCTFIWIHIQVVLCRLLSCQIRKSISCAFKHMHRHTGSPYVQAFVVSFCLTLFLITVSTP